MTIAWNNRKPSYFDQRDDGVSFRTHDERMKRFCLAHPKVKTIESRDARTVDWLALMPIQKVKLAIFSRN